MHIDTFSVAALADEFRLTIMGGRVQKIVQVTAQDFGLEIYSQQKRHQLYLSANPQMPGAYLVSQKPRRGTGNETPLFQLFRKYINSGIVMSVEQPNMERILHFHFSGREGETTLILEMLGTRSNLIFVDDKQRILSLTHPTTPQTSQQRVLLPNRPYQPPPPQNKLTAETLTVEVLDSIIERAPADNLLSKTLVTRLAGLNPLLAREIVHRAYHDAELKVAAVADTTFLLPAIQAVFEPWQTRNWHPYVAFDKAGLVKYFAPIALTHLEGAEPVSSISMAIEAHFNHLAHEEVDGYQAARFPIALAIEQAQKRLARRLVELEKDAAKLEDPTVYREKGEAILAFSYQIEPRQTTLTVDLTGDNPLEIQLDPALTPPENAQRYFSRYQKAKRAADIIPEQVETAQLELEYLNQLALDLETAETRPEIDVVAQALEKAGFGKDFKQQKKKSVQRKAVPAASQPRRFISPDGFVVWVGRNSQQNHHLTFGMAKPDDVWLHARGVPGSHVVIAATHEKPPKSTIEWAASVAAFYSKSKKAGRAVVSYTRKKYVRPIKGAPPGLVRISNESTVQVAPFSPNED